MQLFFDDKFSAENPILNTEESKHCVRVLRHTNGDEISILNGSGTIFTAKITDANPKACKLDIIDAKIDKERSFSIHMVVAPTKNIDRFEWFLEKATEIGVEQITPIICDHSERKVIKPERLEKVLISATKQSLKSYKPVLNPLVKFKDFIKDQENSSDNKFIAHCYDSSKTLLKECYKQNTDAIILIGPEGDFSEEEVKLATANNFQAISLGKARLRTETAALMACATVNFINLTD
ncbi:16S rRNA (uracil(1498)-N(3))-methyltransferase [Plebeiibacterium sediminum]|uniref:Ribosomal RNA small subunit methyltransferase E n=1 Tax=Plebeiibacterium sediminum TaxID=2992112 RepID=A0AAE3M819_9BACT|nr:16S rRNA (uracil(1498)-N(3))-methyltransferase [Plebeiobacterium sediminum]MCW3788652.1 16S rRNA (uracil(1498)-N(3))-methyltransferase [Plebeiobacterium sediminum]